MSRTRRRAAAYRRSVETATKAGNRRVAYDITRRHPLEFVRARRYTATAGWVQGNRLTDVLLEGQLLEVRNRSGQIVLSERFPDYYVPYASWARAVWMRPRPLPRPLRTKLRRRR